MIRYICTGLVGQLNVLSCLNQNRMLRAGRCDKYWLSITITHVIDAMNVEVEIERVLHDIFCNVLTFSDKKRIQLQQRRKGYKMFYELTKI